MFRVANKYTTYAQQLKDYENAVIQKRFEELSEEEVRARLRATPRAPSLSMVALALPRATQRVASRCPSCASDAPVLSQVDALMGEIYPDKPGSQ